MSNLYGKSILIIIPKSQFSTYELNEVKTILQQAEASVVILSKSGQETRGANKDKFQPDGMIVDWDKQHTVKGKYHAVILIGGKGASKSLWDDPIVPQILTDHYRIGSVIGAIGEAIVVLLRASLIVGEIPLPKDEKTRKELERLNGVCIDIPVICNENMVLGQDEDSVSEFVQSIIDCITKVN